MTEEQIERQQVEEVFLLTGGELEDRPLEFRDEDGNDRKWRYHYDGLPEYANEDFPDRHENGVYYCTLVEIGCDYGSSAPERMTFADGDVWSKVESYANSGERECSLGPSGMGETVGEGETEEMDRCPLCEADKGEEHGYIYLGPGCETVYRRVVPSCERCGDSASDLEPTQFCQCYLDWSEASECLCRGRTQANRSVPRRTITSTISRGDVLYTLCRS
jgi:hypothetical protein